MDDKQCLLVIIGATKDGRKELIALEGGYQESEHSWFSILVDLRRRGLLEAPKLAIGDGSLGFWKALAKTYDKTRWQRCWVHKTANILNKLPKSIQPKAKEKIHQIWMASNKEEAEKSFDAFIDIYEAKYPKAVECLKKDRGVLLTFYDFPAEHWRHIRTTNPIESTFATIRHRAEQTKGCGSRKATLSLFYKLGIVAQKSWRKLRGSELLSKVIKGVVFKDGEEVEQAA